MSDPALPADLADIYGPPDDIEAEPDLEAPRLKRVDPRTLPARFHHLKAAGESGAHCLHSFQGEDSDTLAKRLGTATHAMLLGKPFAIWREPSEASVKRQAKARKDSKPLPPLTLAPRSGDKWKKFSAQNAGSLILTESERATAQRMVDAILGHSHAGRLLTAPGLIFERTILWTQSGRSRRSTPDLRRGDDKHGPSFNAEIKTTRCASPFMFGRDAERMKYHGQLADQYAAIEAETGKPPRESYIIAVESSPPHVVQVYEVPKSMLEDGAKLCELWLERLAVYEASDMWGGYSPRIETLAFPERQQQAFADPSWAEGEPDSEGADSQ